MSFSVNRLRLALCLMCIGLGATSLFGQSISIGSASPDLVTCGAPQMFQVDLQNTGGIPLTNVEVSIALNDGVVYQAGSVSGGGVTQQSIPLPDSVIFDSPDIPAFQTVSFTFLAYATCAASDSGFVFNTIETSYDQGQDSVGSDPFSLLRPALSIQSVSPSSVTDTLGATFTRCVTLINGGYGPLNSFFFAIEQDTSRLGISNIRLSPSNTPLVPTYNGDSIVLVLNSLQIATTGNLDNQFDQNETIEICYDVEIRSCQDKASNLLTYWGCYGEICETQFSSANVVVTTDAPIITHSRIFDQNTCYGNGISTTKIIITNTGNGPARDLTIDFWMGEANGARDNYFSSLDTSQIQWKDDAGNVTMVSPYYTENLVNSTSAACLPPNPIRRARILIPFMAPGEQDTLIYQMFDCCKTWCSLNPSVAHRTWYELTYYGICDSTEFNVPPQNIKGYNIGRVISLATNGPTDINPGDTAQYCLEHSDFRFLDFAPGGYAQADLILPPSLNFTGLLSDIYFEDQQGDVWPASNFIVIGDTLRAQFPFPSPPGFNREKSQLKFKLVPNCGGPCDGGPSIIEYNLYEVADTSCNCLSVIYCTSFPVTVHCGVCNCEDGGMVFLDFESIRANYGLPDTNDDGLPDVAPFDTTVTRQNYIMFGDTLRTHFIGVVDTSAANPFWDLGYARSTITRADLLTPIAQSIRIVDVSTGNTFICQLPTPTVATVTGSTRSFTLPFDTTVLSGCMPPGYVFEVGDSVDVTVHYQVTLNASGLVQTQSIDNEFALASSTTGDTAQCDNYSGSFVMVGYYYTNCCYTKYSASGCNQINISQNYYLSVGNCCANYAGGNIFKNEYRHWGIAGQSSIQIPPGYNFISGTLQHVRTRGTQSTASTTVPITPTAISNDSIYFNFANEFSTNGGTIPEGDDGYYGVVRIVLEPTCEVDPDSPSRVRYNWGFDPVPALLASGSANPFRSSYDSLDYQGPSLEISPVLPVIPGIGAQISWDFIIENNSNIHDADNSWFGLVSPSGQIIPSSVVDLGTNNVLTDVNGIYQFGLLEPDSLRTFRIFANYNNCAYDSLRIVTGWDCPGYPSDLASAICIDDIGYVYVEPQPSELQGSLSMPAGPYDICDSILVEINVVSAQLADVANPRVNVLLPINAGLTYQMGSAEMEYPVTAGYGGVADPTISGTLLSWDLNTINALIQANDLPGTAVQDSNSFTLRFYLETNCNFVSGGRFIVQLQGNRICGDPMPQVLIFSDPIDINGAVQPYQTTVAGSSTQNGSCPMDKTIDVSVVNNGSGSSSPNDSIFVDLNPGITYSGNFVGGSNAPTPTVPTIRNLSGGTQLAWPLPAGLSPGDTVQFTFDVDLTESVPCGPNVVTISSTVNSNLFCARDGSTCSAAAQTGSFLLTVPVDRADLNMTGFASSLAPVTGGYEYNYNGTIQNTGVDINAGTTTNVDFYCDSDNSGGYTPGDVLIGNYNTTVAITGAMPHNFAGMINIPNIACSDTNQIFALIVPDSAAGACLCDTAMANTNVVLPVQWLSVNGEVQPQGNLVSWEANLLPGHQEFRVQKQQAYGWQVISEAITAPGSSFEWVDHSPRAREVYRVRQTDQSGLHTYSASVELQRAASGFAVFPNPAKEIVYLRGRAGTPFQLTDLRGKELIKGSLDEGDTPVEIGELPAGVYLLEFVAPDGRVEKIVVE